ncbi:hypothetical protein HAX54_028406 [Datura stramonium]|uniref:ZZ-type domain-containing protein n=1 Tax=Datura stramonium TaxID=4076 RepID=A0ABS8V451_DATST|nr:hypothetical protein [Datura stramonium]
MRSHLLALSANRLKLCALKFGVLIRKLWVALGLFIYPPMIQARGLREKGQHNVENFDTAAAGQILTEKGKEQYHCNYCNKDISGRIRIKCVVCSDFDLCVECFSVGAEVQPHKSNHLYRVMDNLAFPLICADWNADEEMLLLEAWKYAEWQTGLKLPNMLEQRDMSHVMGKSREELLAMAKEQGWKINEKKIQLDLPQVV